MCGFVGVSLPKDAAAPRAELLVRATRAMRHRGPDDEGYLLAELASAASWSYAGEETPAAVRAALGLEPLPSAPPRWDLALGHRRLAIQDLRPQGHQPMASASGDCLLVYNGELYGTEPLRRALEARGVQLRGASDTELLVEAWAAWGPDCLERLNGQFACAVYEPRRGRLTLARDRFGIKPLYLRWEGGRLDFASELRPLRILADEPGPWEVDPEAAYAFLAAGRSDYGRRTCFLGLTQVEAGERVELDLVRRTLTRRRWYELPRRRRALAPAQAVAALRRGLQDAVAARLVADVRVGSCLSGGIDSSTVVGIASALLRERPGAARSLGGEVQAFSARHPGLACDEGEWVDLALAHSGARGHSVVPRGEDLVRELPALVAQQELPFPTASSYAQSCVFRRARAEGVIVTLDGQGADELFAGYPELIAFRVRELFASSRLSELVGEVLGRSPAALPWRTQTRALLRGLLPHELIRWRRRQRWGDLGGLAPELALAQAARVPLHPREGLDAVLRDMLGASSLPGLLRFADRSAMAHSVEARFPFLDHRLVELAFSLPPELKLRRGVTKWVLREAARGWIPERIAARRDKVGFATPDQLWLAGPLLPLAEEVLLDPGLERRFFDPAGVARLLAAWRAGAPGVSAALMRCLVFALWLRFAR
ncbi:MAG TPA: asparagine synthase (glutamine-hydrolyzing) [Planctomycetes bacterium]|nr:asparagine synthase (glutamine-hydrolyzing) [Planctomycetota bacterium]